MASKSLVSLTKEKNTFSKIIWDKKFGGKGVFLPCFELKQLAKKGKGLYWPPLGIKLAHLKGQEGFSYWSTFAENGGNNKAGFSWELPCLNHALQGWTIMVLLWDKSWASNPKTYWLQTLLSLSVKLVHYFSFHAQELSVSQKLCLRLVWIASRWQIPCRDNYSVVERLIG